MSVPDQPGAAVRAESQAGMAEHGPNPAAVRSGTRTNRNAAGMNGGTA